MVEVDGFAFHSTRERFERDRRRDAELSARGFHVIRVTWQRITEEPEAVLVRVGQALAIRRLLHTQPLLGTDDSQRAGASGGERRSQASDDGDAQPQRRDAARHRYVTGGNPEERAVP